MGFSRQEYWSGLQFPSSVDHILSELSTMSRPSWVAPHGMAHSFIELDKAVVHVIRLVSFLWLWFSVCPLMEKDRGLRKLPRSASSYYHIPLPSYSSFSAFWECKYWEVEGKLWSESFGSFMMKMYCLNISGGGRPIIRFWMDGKAFLFKITWVFMSLIWTFKNIKLAVSYLS